MVDYHNVRLTENTRCAYPLEYIPGAKIPAVGKLGSILEYFHQFLPITNLYEDFC